MKFLVFAAVFFSMVSSSQAIDCSSFLKVIFRSNSIVKSRVELSTSDRELARAFEVVDFNLADYPFGSIVEPGLQLKEKSNLFTKLVSHFGLHPLFSGPKAEKSAVEALMNDPRLFVGRLVAVLELDTPTHSDEGGPFSSRAFIGRVTSFKIEEVRSDLYGRSYWLTLRIKTPSGSHKVTVYPHQVFVQDK